MYIEDNRAYFEFIKEYDLAKELLKKHVVIHAAHMGPFGEDKDGITVTGFDVDYADNIENYEGLEGKGWDDLDEEEKEWFDGEDDFEQLNPFWANDIVCFSDTIGQSDVNWADWEMIYEDLWISVPDYRRYVGMEKRDLKKEFLDVLKRNDTLTYEEAAEKLGVSIKQVVAAANEWIKDGVVDWSPNNQVFFIPKNNKKLRDDDDDDMYDNTPIVKQRDESVKIKKAKQILESAGYRLLKM